MYTLVELSSKTVIKKRKLEKVLKRFGYESLFANNYNLIIFHNNVEEISKIIAENFSGDEYIKLSLCNANVLETKFIKLEKNMKKNHIIDFFTFIIALFGLKNNQKTILNE